MDFPNVDIVNQVWDLVEVSFFDSPKGINKEIKLDYEFVTFYFQRSLSVSVPAVCLLQVNRRKNNVNLPVHVLGFSKVETHNNQGFIKRSRNEIK